jgi:hypothetical protein
LVGLGNLSFGMTALPSSFGSIMVYRGPQKKIVAGVWLLRPTNVQTQLAFFVETNRRRQKKQRKGPTQPTLQPAALFRFPSSPLHPMSHWAFGAALKDSTARFLSFSFFFFFFVWFEGAMPTASFSQCGSTLGQFALGCYLKIHMVAMRGNFARTLNVALLTFCTHTTG